MKRIGHLVLCSILMTGCRTQSVQIAIVPQGVPAKVVFAIRDDMGRAVTNALVDGCFLDVSESGARDPFQGNTDENGSFAAKGETGIGVYARFTKDDYYTATVRHEAYLKRLGLTKWEPSHWDIEIPVLLKRVQHPIPLYVQSVEHIKLRRTSNDKVGPYVLNALVGYDLTRGDVVAPHGLGKIADIEFKWKMTIYATNAVGRALEYDTLSEIRMTNVVDGIQRGNPARKGVSPVFRG